MSLAIIHSRASIGIEAPYVSVEVHISNGLPGFTLVGLPETTVREAKDRVRSALINSGFSFPAKRITVNLAPADLPKDGGRFDLPIAIAILVASQQVSDKKIVKLEFIAELALSGELRKVKGVIPAILAASDANRKIILPDDNQLEAALTGHNCDLLANNLTQICDFLNDDISLAQAQLTSPISVPPFYADINEIIGQEKAKRALEIAAAGGHNLLLIGPPGTGKTMLASRLISLLPPLSHQEALETLTLSSLVNNHHITDWQQRPFRAPHHSASMAALIGGGSQPQPGEISLAHNGVLFLDELPEFERKVLDSLRQPLESGEIIISRANAKIRFPAKIQLIAAMNPSPTGHYQGIHNRSNPQQTMRYLNRLSGPFLDRFDLSIEVPLLPKGMLSANRPPGESSEKIRQRVSEARSKQLKRQSKLNCHLNSKEIAIQCSLNSTDSQFLEETLNKLGLSVRSWNRIIKVSRTISDLAGDETINRNHIAEALNYRSMERLLIQLHKAIA